MADGKEAPSPRAAKPAGKTAKAKKKAPPTSQMTVQMPMNKPADLSEDQAKADLEELQKKYGALVVTFNNQQAELVHTIHERDALESRVAQLEELTKSSTPMTEEGQLAEIANRLDIAKSEVSSLEAANMALQKKVNKLQVEHVSEEEVDQLFYALEVKEQQLELALEQKGALEQEVLTARQLSARGGGADPKFIEIHHHNDISDDEDDDAAAPAPAEAAAPVS